MVGRLSSLNIIPFFYVIVKSGMINVIVLKPHYSNISKPTTIQSRQCPGVPVCTDVHH